MAEKAKHAFGALERIDEAIAAGKIDSYDILFVKDADGKPYVGWIDANGEKVIVEDKDQVVRVEELPTVDGDENVVYIYNNEAYVWDGEQCTPLCKPADLTELENQVGELETQIGTKVDEEKVQEMIEAYASAAIEIVEF